MFGSLRFGQNKSKISAGPLKRGHQAAKDLLDLSPASSVVMRACYSLDFSHFRNLHPAFSYPFIPACFMMYFACWIAVGNCLEDDNGAQGPTHLPSTDHGSSASAPPQKTIENHDVSSKISSLSASMEEPLSTSISAQNPPQKLIASENESSNLNARGKPPTMVSARMACGDGPMRKL